VGGDVVEDEDDLALSLHTGLPSTIDPTSNKVEMETSILFKSGLETNFSFYLSRGDLERPRVEQTDAK
jgi:hypothetical protein